MKNCENMLAIIFKTGNNNNFPGVRIMKRVNKQGLQCVYAQCHRLTCRMQSILCLGNTYSIERLSPSASRVDKTLPKISLNVQAIFVNVCFK